MGSGKTLQTIGLILSNPPQGHVYGVANEAQARESVCTLILCNLSVLPHWWEQFERFVEPGILRIGTYRGTREKRAKIVEKLQNNELDVLLAVYETVGKEFEAEAIFDRKTGQPLQTIHDTSFHRVVMDEAHHIRNPETDCSKGARALANASKHVLVLTGK
jgi:DNA repair protein RAD16